MGNKQIEVINAVEHGTAWLRLQNDRAISAAMSQGNIRLVGQLAAFRGLNEQDPIRVFGVEVLPQEPGQGNTVRLRGEKMMIDMPLLD